MLKTSIYSRVFLMPAFLLYTLFFIVPAAGGFYYSFTNWSSYKPDTLFVGLENYKEIFFSTGPYLKSIIHTLTFTFFTVVFKLFFGLALAVLLNEGIKSKKVLRTVFFIPFTLSPLIVGILFVSVLGLEGPLNAVLKFIGLNSWTHSWLTDKGTVLASTMGVEIWRMVGWNMVIFLAGLQMIERTYYEAASLDGADQWKQFTKITIPFLMPTLTIAAILNTIHGLRVFDIIYALTNGGPGDLSEVINTQVYNEFSAGRFGMANALGMIAFLFTLVIALIMKRVSKEEAEIQ